MYYIRNSDISFSSFEVFFPRIIFLKEKFKTYSGRKSADVEHVATILLGRRKELSNEEKKPTVDVSTFFYNLGALSWRLIKLEKNNRVIELPLQMYITDCILMTKLRLFCNTIIDYNVGKAGPDFSHNIMIDQCSCVGM